jgi:enoyl-CoA hydratase/carnithine racemase
VDHILVEHAGAVATVTLNRPERRNAMDRRMWQELFDVLQVLASDQAVRVVVLTGAGRTFCSGADIANSTSGDVSFLTTMRLVGDVALRLHRLPKPTIAKVEGYAVGAGCNMALACDLVVAARGAQFSEIFVQRALSLDFGGSWLLPRLVGLAKAKELAFFGDMVTADEALALGLINQVVAADELDDLVTSWTARLVAAPSTALSATKALLNGGLMRSFEETVEAEAVAQALNVTTADSAEARQAFAEKRSPRFGGH